jgi:hypothetical protein
MVTSLIQEDVVSTREDIVLEESHSKEILEQGMVKGNFYQVN